LIADQRNFRAKYLQNGKKNGTKKYIYLILAASTSYFIYTDLISSLLDSRLCDPGSTLIYVGAYDPMSTY